MAKHSSQDSWSPSLTNESRRLQRLLKDAIPHEWIEAEGGRTLKFVRPLRASEFCETMMLQGDEGYATGARFFMAAVVEGNLERTVCSHLLTSMAKSLHEGLGYSPDAPLREKEVAFFGRFVSHLQQDLAQMAADWAEDMNADDPKRDLQQQPTALIRGVLLSPTIDQHRCVSFWETAAKAARFPLRIFSDPCDAREGLLFSSYHQRVFATVFSVVSTSALEVFTRHMREHAKFRMLLESAGDGKWIQIRLDADENDRKVTFQSIAGHVERASRRQEVADLLGVSAAA